MPNKKFLLNIEVFLEKMENLSKTHDAAVYRAEAASCESPFKVLVFTMLSARTKDETTILALDRLFSIAKTPLEVSALSVSRLESILYGVGFFRTKARYLKELSKILSKSKSFPRTLDELLTLPGVGRKTANIVLARLYSTPTIGVDTHVHRISNRLGLVNTKTPIKTEVVLNAIIPSAYASKLNRAFVAFGQTICTPRNPKCSICPIYSICQRNGLSKINSSTF